MKLLRFFYSPSGRFDRSDYWLGFVGLSVVGFYGGCVIYFLFNSNFELADLLFLGFVLLLAWPSLAVQIKRWHDRDKSGWWVLINWIPLVGVIWSFIELGFLKGTAGANRYGPVPNQPLSRQSPYDEHDRRMDVAAEMHASGKLTDDEYDVLRSSPALDAHPLF